MTSQLDRDIPHAVFHLGLTYTDHEGRHDVVQILNAERYSEAQAEFLNGAYVGGSWRGRLFMDRLYYIPLMERQLQIEDGRWLERSSAARIAEQQAAKSPGDRHA